MRLTDLFESVGATVLANACGPCIGQWKRPSGTGQAQPNSILTSYNRNFPKRNDGNALTQHFIASPEVVTAMAFDGRLDWNPTTQHLKDSSGQSHHSLARSLIVRRITNRSDGGCRRCVPVCGSGG